MPLEACETGVCRTTSAGVRVRAEAACDINGIVTHGLRCHRARMRPRQCNLMSYGVPAPAPETQVVFDSSARAFLHFPAYAAFICGQRAAFNSRAGRLGEDSRRG